MQPSVEQVGTPTSAFRVFVLAPHFYVLRLISFDISELLSRQLLSKRSYPAYFKLYHLLCWQGVRRKATSIVAWLRLLQDHGAADKSSQAVSCFETLGKSGLVAGKSFRYLWVAKPHPADYRSLDHAIPAFCVFNIRYFYRTSFPLPQSCNFVWSVKY